MEIFSPHGDIARRASLQPLTVDDAPESLCQRNAGCTVAFCFLVPNQGGNNGHHKQMRRSDISQNTNVTLRDARRVSVRLHRHSCAQNPCGGAISSPGTRVPASYREGPSAQSPRKQPETQARPGSVVVSFLKKGSSGGGHCVLRAFHCQTDMGKCYGLQMRDE